PRHSRLPGAGRRWPPPHRAHHPHRSREGTLAGHGLRAVVAGTRFVRDELPVGIGALGGAGRRANQFPASKTRRALACDATATPFSLRGSYIHLRTAFCAASSNTPAGVDSTTSTSVTRPLLLMLNFT